MQVRRLTEKLKDMEGSRKWNSRSNEMQYLHCVKVRQVLVEDYRDSLEEHFGDRKKIPPKLELVVKKGEKEINERIKVLKMADRVSWSAVDKYQADPLCDGEEDDKKWKQAVKEAKEEKDGRKRGFSGRGYRRNSPVRYSGGYGRDGYSNRDRRPYDGRFGGRDSRQDSRYGKIGGGLVGDSFTVLHASTNPILI